MAQEAVVTEEQRQQELANLDTMRSQAKAAAAAKTPIMAELEQLSALERLMRQEATDTFNLVFQDAAGDYHVPVRYLTVAERRGVIKMIADLGVAGAAAGQEGGDPLRGVGDAFDTIVEMAASMVTDPVFAQGIRDGKISDKQCMLILKTGLKRTVALEETGASFRLN